MIFEPDATLTAADRRRHLLFDALMLLAILAYAFCIQEGLRLGTVEGVYNPFRSDVAEYSGRIARDHHPENFSVDAMFGHGSWSTSFFTLHGWLGDALATGDNYNWGLMRIAGPCAFVFLTGFYLLGLYLFRSRPVACLLAAAAGMSEVVLWGTFWGITAHPPVPRTLYDTFYPYLIWAAFAAARRPVWRPVVMLAAGCLVYVHSVSAIATGGALFVGFALTRPKEWPWGRFLAQLALCAALFLVPVVVFSLPILLNKGQASPEDMAVFREMFRVRFSGRFGPPFEDLWRFIVRYTVDWPLIPAAAVSFVAGMRRGSERIRSILRLCLCWLIGIVLCGACVDWLEQQVMARLGKLSIMHQLIRGTRFSIPVLYLMIACGLSVWFAHVRRRTRVAVFLIAVVLLATVLYPWRGRVYDYVSYYIQTNLGLHSELTERMDAEVAAQKLRRDALLALREQVPVTELVYSNTADAGVRYVGLRSLAHTSTDGPHLFFQYDVEGCRRWLRNHKALATPTGYIEAWLESDAPWLLTDRPQDEALLTPHGTVVWRNKGYLLLRREGNP